MKPEAAAAADHPNRRRAGAAGVRSGWVGRRCRRPPPLTRPLPRPLRSFLEIMKQFKAQT